MLQEVRKYGSLFLLVSITSMMLSSVPHLIFESLHTLSYEMTLFEQTSHYDLHEQCIEHKHDVLEALEKTKESKRSSKTKQSPTTKLQKISETHLTLHLCGSEPLYAATIFRYIETSLRDGYLETLGEPPEAVF